MIFSLSGNETAAERMTDMLPMSELTGFIRFLWPGETDFIEEFLLLLIHSKDQVLSGSSYAGSFESLLQKMILYYLFSAAAGSFNRQTFIRFGIRYISPYSNRTTTAILQLLLNTAVAQGKTGVSEHLQIFKDLQKTDNFDIITGDKYDHKADDANYHEESAATRYTSFYRHAEMTAGKNGAVVDREDHDLNNSNHRILLPETLNRSVVGSSFSKPSNYNDTPKNVFAHPEANLSYAISETRSFKLKTAVSRFADTDPSFLQTGKIKDADQNTLSDIFYYFLYYGNMPWWGKKYSSQSPETLLKRLYDLSADTALLVLKRAGMERRSRQRFLWQFSEESIYQLFNLLPDWDLVSMTIELALELIEFIPQFGQLKQLSLKYLLLESVWDSYIQHQYSAFQTGSFYQYLIERLSHVAFVEKKEIILHFREAILKKTKGKSNDSKVWNSLMNITDGQIVYRNNELQDLQAADEMTAHALEEMIKQSDLAARDILIPGTNTLTEITNDSVRTENIRYGNLDLLIGKYTGSKVALSFEDRQQQLISLLEYYLTWNRLPDSVLPMSKQEFDQHLSEMLLLLFHQDRDALKRILHSEKHSSKARMHLHRLFLPDRKGGDHKQLSLLLDDYIEKDALQYIKEIAEKGNLSGEQELKPALDLLLDNAKNGAIEELSLLLKSVPLTKYMARNYGNETVDWLIDHRSGNDQTFRFQSNLVRNLLLDLIGDTAGKQRLRILLNEATLFYLSGMENPKNIMGYIRYLFRFLSGSVYSSVHFFTILLKELKTDVHLLSAHKELALAMRHELEQQSQIREREASIRRSIEKGEQQTRIAEAAAKLMQEKVEQELLRKQQEEQKKQKKMAPILEKGNKLYVNNSGLVLLHPFLSTYFTRLRLMEKGEFIHPEARARAVHLLQYLADHTTQHPEQELVLNKILCNYPLHEPLPLEIIITPEEADLSAELLQVVIQRAGKLSNSSAEGFQVSFLQRQGMITATEDAWTLRVEQRGYDVLLPTLPWAFGMVKFQWMDKTLLVEWI